MECPLSAPVMTDWRGMKASGEAIGLRFQEREVKAQSRLCQDSMVETAHQQK